MLLAINPSNDAKPLYRPRLSLDCRLLLPFLFLLPRKGCKKAVLLTGTLRTLYLTWLSVFINDHSVSCNKNRNANLLFTTFKYDGQISLAPTFFWYDGYKYSRSEAMPSRRFHIKHRHEYKQCKIRRVKIRLIRKNYYCGLFIELKNNVTSKRRINIAHVDKNTTTTNLFCRTNNSLFHFYFRSDIYLSFYY